MKKILIKLRSVLLLIIIVIVIGYVSFTALLFFSQAKYIYYPDYPTRDIEMTPEAIGLKCETIYFESMDGIKLNGWFIPAENPQGTVLFCHGNAGNISHRLESIQLFHKLKLNTFIFDYRGYGKSEGKPAEKGTYYDVKAAWDYLVHKKGINSEKIIIFGRSLGGAIAAWCAHKNTPKMLIIESTFTSIPDLAAKIYPFLPVRLLSRFKYNTADYIPKINCPVLIIHSRDDEIVPFSHGQRLFKIAREPKEFLPIMGTHNESTVMSNKSYEAGINNFLCRF